MSLKKYRIYCKIQKKIIGRVILKKLKQYSIVLIGSCILSFGLYNIHKQCGITEGGELGLELLLLHWFNISPAVTSVILDIIFYGFGFSVLGRGFVKQAAAATIFYSVSYAVWSAFPPLLPNLSAHPLLAALCGAVFIGFGCGLVVRQGGACSGDDALALALSKKFSTKIEYCYWISDITVLLFSLSYIPFKRIFYSLLTVTLSSWLVGYVQRFEIKKR